MKPSKNLLFTFDYELFLGRSSGSVEKCMLAPTRQLIGLFERYGIANALFFVDTTYLLRLKEVANVHPAAKVDFDAIQQQLQELIRKGHLIYPHIHPHWQDATYDVRTNNWSLPSLTYYRFHALQEKEREAIFDNSIRILNDIISPVTANYKMDGYRAGGWCIQPFSDFYPCFKKHGIVYDFSVLPGMKNLSTAQYYDFQVAPKKVYQFEMDITQAVEGGSFIEVPISLVRVSAAIEFANKLLLKFLWKTGNRSVGDGSGVVAQVEENIETIKNQHEMVSIELLTRVKLKLYQNFLRQNTLMHFISHPKMLSAHNFACLEQFLKHATKHYDVRTNFRELVKL